MAGSTYGTIFRIMTWGESHGKGVGVTIDGCPAGLPLCEEDIQTYLNRRKPGQSKFTTARNESDRVEILSGVFEGKTTGTPIAMMVRNTDQRSKDYSAIMDVYRPGHADYSRVMCIEIMGNKAGWLTLYSGIAGGADIILLPEQPYDIDRVCDAVERRARKGSNFSIIAVAEGAINTEEAKMKRKEWMAKRAEAGYGVTATNRIAAAVQKKTGMETRVCIPGHMQRGGSPSAYDRVLATEFGSYAAKLVEVERYGVTVAMVNNRVIANRLEDIAGKARNIPEGCELLTVARRMGVSLG